MTTEIDILTKFLLNRNLKKTAPRFQILDVFLSTEGHISAYELHALIKKKHPEIGFSTVYRSLKLLVESKLANEVNFGDGQSRFEKAFKRSQHGHLICTSCGKTEEFISESINNLKKKISGKHKYKLQGANFEIYGLCQDCQ